MKREALRVTFDCTICALKEQHLKRVRGSCVMERKLEGGAREIGKDQICNFQPPNLKSLSSLNVRLKPIYTFKNTLNLSRLFFL